MNNEPTSYHSSFKLSGIFFTTISSTAGIKKIIMNNPVIDLRNSIRLRADDPYLYNIRTQLKEYFSGERKVFDLPLDLQGTDFQLKVWSELLKIPYGETITYKELANRLGNPKCIRAAAKANGSNPVPIIVPCHRVTGSDGSLTGYAAGLEIKEKLLVLEGSRTVGLFN